MRERFVFEIRAISIEVGYELFCEGIMETPLRVERLFEAVVLAATLGESVNFEIRILDVDGREAEVIALDRLPALSRSALACHHP